MSEQIRTAFDYCDWAVGVAHKVSAEADSVRGNLPKDARREKNWLKQGMESLTSTLDQWKHQRDRVLDSAPGLDDLRAKTQTIAQAALVTAVNQLIAETQQLGGKDGPLTTALQHRLEVPNPKRCAPEAFLRFVDDLQTRLASGYFSRMLQEPAYLSLQSTVDTVTQNITAVKRWTNESTEDSDPKLDPCDEVLGLARSLAIALRQASLLIQAAAVQDEELGLRLNQLCRPPKKLRILDAA